MKVTDELLNAYIDGTLDPNDAGRVAAAIAGDPETAERLKALEQVDSLLRGAGAVIDKLPIPNGVEALFHAAPDHSSTVVRLADWRRLKAHLDRFALPIAASVALAVGLAGGLGLAPKASGDGLIVAEISSDSPLQRVLEKSASGVAQRISASTQADVKLSFQDAEGAFCREVEIEEDGTQVIRVVACRESPDTEEQPEWRIRMASITRVKRQAEGYQTAAAEDDAAFDRGVAALMAGDALDINEERRLIGSGWKQ